MNKIYFLAAVAAAFGVSAAHAAVITSAGSTTVQPAMKACAKVYKKSHADSAKTGDIWIEVYEDKKSGIAFYANVSNY